MQRFVLLDLMRFVLALMVAMAHFQGYAAPVKAYLAVDFFFILSGFVLLMAYARKADAPGFYRDFALDRFSRLYPLHFATLLILVPINVLFYYSSGGQFLEGNWSYHDGRVYTFILNLFMAQNIGLNTDGSWNAPSWSISVEVFVNIFLAAAILPICKRKLRWPALLLFSVLCYVAIFAAFGNLGRIYDKVFGLINSGLLRGFAGVSLGAVCYVFYERLSKFTRLAGLATVGAVLSAMLGLFLMSGVMRGGVVDMATVPVMFILVLSAALHERFRPLQEGKAKKFMILLGGLSYAVYLCHWPILTFTRYQLVYLGWWKMDLSTPLALAGFLAAVLGVSYVSFRFYEMPMKRAVKDWAKRRRQTPLLIN